MCENSNACVLSNFKVEFADHKVPFKAIRRMSACVENIMDGSSFSGTFIALHVFFILL